jgi:hypothetical protein
MFKTRTAESILKEAKLHRRVWGKAIIKAERNGGFTEAEMLAAKNWRTCGVLKNIPKNPDGVPVDTLITRMGAIFGDFVCTNNVVKAAKCLVEIEKLANALRVRALYQAQNHWVQ